MRRRFGGPSSPVGSLLGSGADFGVPRGCFRTMTLPWSFLGSPGDVWGQWLLFGDSDPALQFLGSLLSFWGPFCLQGWFWGVLPQLWDWVLSAHPQHFVGSPSPPLHPGLGGCSGREGISCGGLNVGSVPVDFWGLYLVGRRDLYLIFGGVCTRFCGGFTLFFFFLGGSVPGF